MYERGWWLRLEPPESMQSLFSDLQQINLFPADKTWWFAWNALDIKLPGPLMAASDTAANWEVVRIFSAQAELRMQKRGNQLGYWLLLEGLADETAVMKTYGKWLQGSPGAYWVEKGYHILAGQKLELPQSTKRGELIYPRTLDYEVGQADLEQAVVAEVQHYYDQSYRKVTARYAGLGSKTPGSISVQRYEKPEVIFQNTGGTG